MREISGLLVEYGGLEFEEIVDVYLNKQKVKKLSFSADKISKILGVTVSVSEIENILKDMISNTKIKVINLKLLCLQCVLI